MQGYGGGSPVLIPEGGQKKAGVCSANMTCGFSLWRYTESHVRLVEAPYHVPVTISESINRELYGVGELESTLCGCQNPHSAW